MEAGAFVVGFLVTQTLGQGVRYMLDHLQLESISSPSGIEQKKWEAALTSENRKIGGRWVGHLERFAFFASFWFLPSDAHLLVGGWLTFKLAAKWESWRNVVRIPEKFTEQPNILDELRAK